MKKRQMYNSLSSLFKQLVVVVIGLILPRLIIRHYGSEANGLVVSITNFLSLITFAELGIGSVVKTALYKPLAEKNDVELSKIIVSASRFYHLIACVLIVYTLFLALFLSSFAPSPYDQTATAILVIAISINLLSKYMLGIIPRLLLTADRVVFIPSCFNIVQLIVNCIISVILILHGCSLVTVKLTSAVVLCIRPIILRIIVNRRYHLDYSVTYTEEPIQQKWNGVAQHVAAIVRDKTDVVVLTFFSSYSFVSVYFVYSFVSTAIEGIVDSLNSGLMSLLGHEYVKKDNRKNLLNLFSSIETYVHWLCSILFSCTLVLVNNFVILYTCHISDINYIYPLFGFLLVWAKFLQSIRLPYNYMVFAAGHYKQTQKSSMIEASINLIVSILLVMKYQLIGVAIGTILAMSYRTLYLVWYLEKHIIYRKVQYFIAHLFLDVLVIISVCFFYLFLKKFCVPSANWLIWVVISCVVFCFSFLLSSLVHFLFFRKDFLSIRSIFQ